MRSFCSCEQKNRDSTTSTILNQNFSSIDIVSEVKFKIFKLNFQRFKYFEVVLRTKHMDLLPFSIGVLYIEGLDICWMTLYVNGVFCKEFCEEHFDKAIRITLALNIFISVTLDHLVTPRLLLPYHLKTSSILAYHLDPFLQDAPSFILVKHRGHTWF